MHRTREEQVLCKDVQKFEHGDLPREELEILVVQYGCSFTCNNCVDEGDAPKSGRCVCS